jgi:hypothetical protein
MLVYFRSQHMQVADFDSMELGRILTITAWVLALGIVNFILADLAGRWHGRFWQWFIAFFIIPGISHIFVVVFLILQIRKVKDMKTIQKVLAAPLKPDEDGESKSEGVGSVTPFATPEGSRDDGGEQKLMTLESRLEILGKNRDVRLDEFIARDELNMANGFARRWRALAVKKEQADLIEMYDRYIEIIEPYVTS